MTVSVRKLLSTTILLGNIQTRTRQKRHTQGGGWDRAWHLRFSSNQDSSLTTNLICFVRKELTMDFRLFCNVQGRLAILPHWPLPVARTRQDLPLLIPRLLGLPAFSLCFQRQPVAVWPLEARRTYPEKNTTWWYFNNHIPNPLDVFSVLFPFCSFNKLSVVALGWAEGIYSVTIIYSVEGFIHW